MDADRLAGRLALEDQALLLQDLFDLLARLGDAQAGQSAGHRGHSPIAVDGLDQGQLVGVPPGHVGLVAKSAAHDRPGAFGRVGGRIGQDGHRLAIVRHPGRMAGQMLDSALLRVDEDGHAGRQQLGAGGGDGQACAHPAGKMAG